MCYVGKENSWQTNNNVDFIFIVIDDKFVYLFKIKSRSLPGIDIPQISIHTVYPGASPREVEESVSRVLESGLSSVKNLKIYIVYLPKKAAPFHLNFIMEPI